MSGREGHGELKKLSSQLFAETASAHTDAHVPASGGGTVGAPPPPAVEHTTHHNQRHDEKEYLNVSKDTYRNSGNFHCHACNFCCYPKYIET